MADISINIRKWFTASINKQVNTQSKEYVFKCIFFQQMWIWVMHAMYEIIAK